MKRIILTLILCACATTQTMAQFDIGLSLGYGFPSGKMGMGLANYEARDTGMGGYAYTSYKDVYLSLGNGLKIDVNGCYNLNDNLGVMANIGVSMLGGTTITTEVTDMTVTPSELNTTTMKLNSAFLPINIGLKAKAALGAVEPYAYLAPGLYIPLSVTGETKNETTGQPTTTIDTKMKVAAGFGFAGGLGAAIKLSDLLALTVEFAPNYAFARLKESKSTFSDGTSFTTIFKQNQETLPADITTGTNQTYYQHGGPLMSFSSMGAKVGMVLSF